MPMGGNGAIIMCIRCDDDRPAFKHDLCKPCWATVFGPAWDEAKAKADKWNALVDRYKQGSKAYTVFQEFKKQLAELENDDDKSQTGL